MGAYSISFTLGKASSEHGGNIQHNNRKFTAPNVDPEKEKDNIYYKTQDIREAYHDLFDEAVEEYNKKQTRPCRKIKNYFEHINEGKREEIFYETVVQFGNFDDSPCGSERGEEVKQLLDEYMKEFQERNPNLYVFNAVLHMDEASPHIHIDFIPYYTKGRVNGLSKGVSMKAALAEQGFKTNSKNFNCLVSWEASERKAMEVILNRRGHNREDMNATYTAITLSLTQFVDWGLIIPVWTIIFFFFNKDKMKMTLLFISTTLIILPVTFLRLYDSFWYFTLNYGALLALIPIHLYNGKRDRCSTPLKKKINRWFFYIYYPLHMIILSAIAYK